MVRLMSDNSFRLTGVTGEGESEIVGYLNRDVISKTVKDEV